MQTTVREFLSQYRVRPKPQPVLVRDNKRHVSKAIYDQLLDAVACGDYTAEWVADRYVVVEGANA